MKSTIDVRIYSRPYRSVITLTIYYDFASSAPVAVRVPRSSSSLSKISSFIPERARPSTTTDVFFYHSKQTRDQNRAAPGK